MANYDFNNVLSPERFQDMARDILQIKYENYAETFKKVKDGGIDIRMRDKDKKIYGQVKRFSNLSKLKYNLKTEEIKKVEKLNPDRYILITSLDYTPQDKSEIMDIFKGYIKNEEDIIGKSDINNLLSQDKYKNIQRKYYELWMDSFEIMEELIDNSNNKHIIEISSQKLKDISKNEKTYVENMLSEKAEDIISKNNCVLITGEAGIGKTSLAYHITYKMMQNKGTKFAYVYSPEEILKLYQENVNQIFLIDDFWGSIFENSYEKREEKKFIDVINMINSSKNKKLILTSRDYILEEGLRKHPKVYDKLLDNKVIIKLKEFSELLKAKIIFKHLNDSNLEWDIVDEIASNYKSIIKHTMYNPRLIAEYIKKIDNEPKQNKSYIRELLDYLDNPESFIKDIFEEQTEAAKVILIFLLLMRREVEEQELKEIFYNYVDSNNNDISKTDFTKAIKELDGNLIRIYRDKFWEEELVINIDFQNPSVEEFVYNYFVENVDDYVEDIIKSTNNLNLLASLSGVYMVSTDYKRNFYNIDTGHKLLVNNIKEVVTNKVINSYDDLTYIYQREYIENDFSEGYSELDKINKLIKINNEINSNKLKAFIQKKIDNIFEGLIKRNRFFTYDDMYEVIPLLKDAKDYNYIIKYKPIEIIKGYCANIKYSYQYSLMNRFSRIYPEVYEEFRNNNKKEIKKNILELIIDDIEFYEEGQYDDLTTFIELELPNLLKEYNMRLPKWMKEEIEYITGIDWWAKERIPKPYKRKTTKHKPYKPHDKKYKLIEEELVKLLGEDKDDIISDEKQLIFETIKNPKLANRIYYSFKDMQTMPMPVSIYSLRFFKRILTFINKQNKAYESIGEFFNDFIDYCLGKSAENEKIKKILEKFCYEMCMENRNIWREEEIRSHYLFKENPEIIDLLIKRKILERNSQWIEFYNRNIFWYFCIIYSININENVSKFINKLRDADSLADKEFLVIMIYESIMPEKIHKEFIEKEIEGYIKCIERKEQKECYKKIIEECEYELTLDSKLRNPEETVSGAFIFNILEYARYYFRDNIPQLFLEIKKNKEDFIILKNKFYKDGTYTIDFLQSIDDEEIYQLFQKYGIYKEFYNTYIYSKKILELMRKNNYKTNIRHIKNENETVENKNSI